MRELGFSVLWPKLAKPTTTTFRFTRKDKDWEVGEVVKVVYKPRSKRDRSVLGQAEIIKKELRWVQVATDKQVKHQADYFAVKVVTEEEAKIDGFASREAMVKFMREHYHSRHVVEAMNRLTLAWTQYWLYTQEQKAHIAQKWAELLKKVNHPVAV